MRMPLVVEAGLSGYSAVLFSDSRILGAGILAATFVNPWTGLTGLIGVLFSNVLAMLFGVHRERIAKGLYGFNGLLVGLSVSLHHQVDWGLIALLLVALVFLLMLTLSLEHFLGYFFGLPPLSLPFVITSMILYFALYNYTAFTPNVPAVFPGDAFFPDLPYHVLLFLKSMGAIFFQTSPWAGLVVALAVLAFSRLAMVLAIIGYAAGVLFHGLMGGNPQDIAPGSIGFNNILTAVAIGGIFVVPGYRSFLLAFFAAMVSSLMGSFAKIFLIHFSMPLLALPFTTVTLFFLHGLRTLGVGRFRLVDFAPGSPEKNIDYYTTRLKRFGESGLEIRLPFHGQWKVTQGYNGEHTHKDLWRESLDFMALTPDGALWQGARASVNDYPTWGLPVLAPADGRVVRVVNHLDDNPLGQLDTKNNWGNLVLIQHAPFLYSQLSHLKKGSVTVHEGEMVRSGARLAQAGNSGRSSEPHLHIHFQRTPEVGSPTLAVSFSQLVSHGERAEIRFNAIPQEGAAVSPVVADFTMSTFFGLAPGLELTVRMECAARDGGEKRSRLEAWQISLDFFGNRYIENDAGDRLYYQAGDSWFACLGYRGGRESALFRTFLAVYRIPFAGMETGWQDRMSHSFFHSLPVNIVYDMLLPFTDRFSMQWHGRIVTSEAGLSVESRVLSGAGSQEVSGSLLLAGSFPGLIRGVQNNGISYEITAVQA